MHLRWTNHHCLTFFSILQVCFSSLRSPHFTCSFTWSCAHELFLRHVPGTAAREGLLSQHGGLLGTAEIAGHWRKAEASFRLPVIRLRVQILHSWRMHIYIYMCVCVCVFVCFVGRDSSVGIATRYGLDDPGIESWWGRDFPYSSRPALGPPSLLYNGYQVFPGVKQPGRGFGHPPHLAPRLRKE